MTHNCLAYGIKDIVALEMNLYDRRIVSYVIGNSNNNALVSDTFDAAIDAHPEAHSLFHKGFNISTGLFTES